MRNVEMTHILLHHTFICEESFGMQRSQRGSLRSGPASKCAESDKNFAGNFKLIRQKAILSRKMPNGAPVASECGGRGKKTRCCKTLLFH